MHSLNFSDLQPYLFCISGIIFIVFALFKKTKKKSLGIASERAEGTIFELQGNANSSGKVHQSNSIAEDKIIVKFVTKHKKWITAPIKSLPGTYDPRHFKIGDKVNVIYNPY